ncbi:hypothetical protein BDN72DRAFT_966401 [Pluteus cervinus]|uniref:Uncharacterized protein n=1 Tax=Pluteus cervinus TaxID=181527 RepID=A0ACD2ZZY2_9AGAR|nr:hypothetical protein BDN72DRAFT_966401 [Pluteus cervinus]
MWVYKAYHKVPKTKKTHPNGLVPNHKDKLLVKRKLGLNEPAPGKNGLKGKGKAKGKEKQVTPSSNRKPNSAQSPLFSQGARPVIDAVKQVIKKRQKLGNATANSNDVIELLSDSEEQVTPGPSTSTSSVVGRKVATTKARSLARAKQSIISIKSEPSVISIKSEPSVLSVDDPESSPPPTSTFIRRAPASKKRAPASPISLSDSSSLSTGPTTKTKSFTAADIPQFLTADWKSKFLPTLYDVFFCSNHPYNAFCQGNEFGATATQVLDIIIPGHQYKVHSKEPVYCVALERIHEKRSDIGHHVAKVVATFFEQPEYKDRPKAIAAYVEWATQKHGPAYYKTPSPASVVKLEPKQQGFQAPQGPFESNFIVGTMNTFLDSTSITKSKAVDIGYPESLLALVCAAFHLHFETWSTGHKLPVYFAREHVEGPGNLDRYVKFVNQINDKRWEHLLQLWGMPKRGSRVAGGADGIEDEEGMYMEPM